jgi:hypothetical protein
VDTYDSLAMRQGVVTFLADALSARESLGHLRRANMLVSGKQGSRAGYGMVRDSVLKRAGIRLPAAGGKVGGKVGGPLGGAARHHLDQDCR